MSEKPRLILPNTGEVHQPEVYQDHTGVRKTGRPLPEGTAFKNRLYDYRRLMKTPAWLQCPGCSGFEFRVLVDSHPQGNATQQLLCIKKACGRIFPVVQLRAPQMTTAFESEIVL